MKSQKQKYINRPDILLVTASFLGDNRGYTYLCQAPVKVGDAALAHQGGNEYKTLVIRKVGGVAEMQDNPSWGKYKWLIIIPAVIADDSVEVEDTFIDESSDANNIFG